jgi:hypothetical protein
VPPFHSTSGPSDLAGIFHATVCDYRHPQEGAAGVGDRILPAPRKRESLSSGIAGCLSIARSLLFSSRECDHIAPASQARPKAGVNEMSGSSQHLADRRHPHRVYLCHALRKLLCQIAPAQMDVETGRLNTSMTRERCDFMDVPVCPGKIGQTQVSQGVRGEPRQTTTLGYPRDGFRPGPYRNRSATIPIGFRNEQRSTLSTKLSAFAEILSEESICRLGVRYYTFAPILRNLQSDADKPVRRIDVSSSQRTNLGNGEKRVHVLIDRLDLDRWVEKKKVGAAA